MERSSPDVEAIPDLYRGVLDMAAVLGRAEAHRRDADHFRAEAMRIYAEGWTPRCERDLRVISLRLARALARTVSVSEPEARPVGRLAAARRIPGLSIRR